MSSSLNRSGKDDRVSDIIDVKDDRVNIKTNSNLCQLFARIIQEIEEKRPKNQIHFIVEFLIENYPEHLKEFSALWNSNTELEYERLKVIEFFKSQKIPTSVALNFTNAGFDTVETLCSLNSDSLDEIEKFNKIKWLPGHKIRLQLVFGEIVNKVRNFRSEREEEFAKYRSTYNYNSHYPYNDFYAPVSNQEHYVVYSGNQPYGGEVCNSICGDNIKKLGYLCSKTPMNLNGHLYSSHTQRDTDITND